MALDMFLDITGDIGGESQDKVHKGKIDILAWSWGISQAGSFHSGGGGGAGKANFQDISLTKWIDKASPILQLYCANGDHFAEAKIIVRKAGKTPLEYLTITMKKVLITSVSTGGSGGEDKLTENVSLNFAEVNVKYVEQTADGAEGAKPEFKWDIAANAPA
jgi:type VI secretion system secreted protein Hcp